LHRIRCPMPIFCRKGNIYILRLNGHFDRHKLNYNVLMINITQENDYMFMRVFTP
jgi:hypothetical protein